MQQEWEKIRREQQDWASARREERHRYSDQFPFGNPHARNQGPMGGPFSGTPFGFGPGPGGPHQNYPQNPLDGFFRTMIYVFAFFMAFRLIGLILFGPRDERGRGRRYGPGPMGGPYRNESPFYDNPDDYGRYRNNFPPPLSLREKQRKLPRYGEHNPYDDQMSDDDDRRPLRRRGKYVPPPPSPLQQQREGSKGEQAVQRERRSRSSAPKPRNSLKDPRRSMNESELKEDDGNKITFHKPSDQQTTDVSSPGEQRRRDKKRRSKYERMLEEQRMMEEVYIRARRKQLQEQEEERRREMERRTGSGRKGPRGAGWN